MSCLAVVVMVPIAVGYFIGVALYLLALLLWHTWRA